MPMPTQSSSDLPKPDAAPDSPDLTRLDAPSPSAAEIIVRRRRVLLAGTAAVAALGGAAVQWWHSPASDGLQTAQGGQPGVASSPSATNAESASPPNQNDVAALAAFWDLKFDTPAGLSLATATLRGKPLVVNFWATWCPPCIEELPLINSFFRENSAKGWQVLGIAVDNLAPVKNFLVKTPVDFPVALAGMAGVALSQSFGNLSGGLPFTVVLGASGAILQRKIGKIGPDDVRAWASLK